MAIRSLVSGEFPEEMPPLQGFVAGIWQVSSPADTAFQSFHRQKVKMPFLHGFVCQKAHILFLREQIRQQMNHYCGWHKADPGPTVSLWKRKGGFYSLISHHTQLHTCHVKLESLQKSLSILSARVSKGINNSRTDRGPCCDFEQPACHKYNGHMLRNSFSRCCYERFKYIYMRAAISICVVGKQLVCKVKLSIWQRGVISAWWA